MIEHSVTFALKHAPGSAEEREFLSATQKLATLPGVQNFRIRRQSSPKNSHTHGIHMHFDNAAEFQSYCDHPDHLAFVNERWLKEVSDFREADFEPLEPN